MQQGRCKGCKSAISGQYPAVELATALLFTLTVVVFGLSFKTLLLCWLLGSLMVILITDFREQFIFDVNSLGLIPFGLIYGWVQVFEQGFTWLNAGLVLWHAVLAIGLSWLIFKLLNLFSNALFKVDGFGEGDVRLLMGMGAFFGFKAVVAIFLGSFVLQMVLTLPLLCWQWFKQGRLQVLGLFVGSVAVSALPYAFAQLDYLPKIALTLVCAVVALFMAFKAVRQSQAHPTGLTYMPFGPAICVACVVWVFAQAAGVV
jgi:leader peptidase (prepilin peptidase)/N-methyltransferase